MGIIEVADEGAGAGDRYSALILEKRSRIAGPARRVVEVERGWRLVVGNPGRARVVPVIPRGLTVQQRPAGSRYRIVGRKRRVRQIQEEVARRLDGIVPSRLKTALISRDSDPRWR